MDQTPNQRANIFNVQIKQGPHGVSFRELFGIIALPRKQLYHHVDPAKFSTLGFQADC